MHSSSATDPGTALGKASQCQSEDGPSLPPIKQPPPPMQMILCASPTRVCTHPKLAGTFRWCGSHKKQVGIVFAWYWTGHNFLRCLLIDIVCCKQNHCRTLQDAYLACALTRAREHDKFAKSAAQFIRIRRGNPGSGSSSAVDLRSGPSVSCLSVPSPLQVTSGKFPDASIPK